MARRFLRLGAAFVVVGVVTSQIPMTGSVLLADGSCPGPINPVFKMTATDSASAPGVGPVSTIPRSSISGPVQGFFAFYSANGGTDHTAVNASEWKLTVLGPTVPDEQGYLGRIRWSTPGGSATTIAAPNSATITGKHQVDLKIPTSQPVGSVHTQGTLQASYTPPGSSTTYVVSTNLQGP